MKHIILTIILIVTVFTVKAQSIYQDSDTVYCFVLKEEFRDGSNFSRGSMIVNMYRNCYLKTCHTQAIDTLLDKLTYVKELPYNSDELAMRWVVPADTLVALKSLTPPVKAFIARYNHKPANRKHYTQSDLKEIIWITDTTVEIGNREYRLSPELKQFLFGAQSVSN